MTPMVGTVGPRTQMAELHALLSGMILQVQLPPFGGGEWSHLMHVLYGDYPRDFPGWLYKAWVYGNNYMVFMDFYGPFHFGI